MGIEHGRDLDLLVGLLAARLFQIPTDALHRTGRGWLAESGRSLRDELFLQRLINEQQARLLDSAVDALVVAQQGDPSAALALIGGPELAWRYLGQISGRAPGDEDPHATRPMGDDSAFATLSELSTLEEVSGRYSKISDHARGGMGRILLVQDLKMEREVAVKELLLPDSENALGDYSPVRMAVSLTARFLQEGRITASLEYPYIVRVYEIGHRTDGTLYYTMKLVRGKTLSEALRAAPDLGGRLRLLSNFVDVCNAIAYAHSRHVIHRDIKRANIMIGAFGETVVLDWGLAKAHGKDDPREEEIERTLASLRESPGEQSTQYGEAVGTPSYMSPEQARGELDAVDERSDVYSLGVYSLGVVLFEMLTGRVPTDGLNASETLRHVAYGDSPSLLSQAPDTPPELASICHKAIAKAKEDRYASPLELADEISRFTSGVLVKSYEYSFRQLIARYYQKNRALVHLSAAALAVIAIISSYAFVAVQAARYEARLRAYSAQIRLADKAQMERDFASSARALGDAEPALRDELWRVLQTRQDQATSTVRQGQRAVFYAAWALEGSRFITVSGDRTVRIYEFPGSIFVRELRPGPFINNAAVSLNGKRLALAMMDGYVRILSTETGHELGSYPLTATPI